jgi:hypothetical protein
MKRRRKVIKDCENFIQGHSDSILASRDVTEYTLDVMLEAMSKAWKGDVPNSLLQFSAALSDQRPIW